MRRIVILGGGESGCGAAVLAKKKGYGVFLSDNGTIGEKYRAILREWDIPFEEGGHSESKLLEADEVVKSPGIPDETALVRAICSKGIPVISEIEFAGRHLDGAKTICVTGSNGKTTTASLIYRILKDAGYNAALGGNIGKSLAYLVATENHDWYVLEISSFQLDGMSRFKADTAVLTNITPDHLDRYGYDMRRYVESKMGIIRNQTNDDYFIYCEDDANIRSAMERRELPMRLLPFSLYDTPTLHVAVAGHGHETWQGAYVSGDDIVAQVGGDTAAVPVPEIRIKGKHNIYNAMAATLAAMTAGVAAESIRTSLRNFEGIEHRLEYAGEVDGVEYINDSKATNTDSAWYALESMEKPVVWIAGGTDKGNDYSELKKIAEERVKTLVCMGKDNSKIIKEFESVVPRIYDTHSLDEAMSAARGAATEGDVVLLSPACASFDLFSNYEERGNMFKEWVRDHSDHSDRTAREK